MDLRVKTRYMVNKVNIAQNNHYLSINLLKKTQIISKAYLTTSTNSLLFLNYSKIRVNFSLKRMITMIFLKRLKN